jgi:uncharacterized protein
MAIQGLTFRARAGNAAPVDQPDGIQLRGEIEWIVTGGEAEILALQEAVGGLGVAATAGVAILKFGNVVGRFDLGSLGTLSVRCGKWGEDAFDTLLEDLTRKLLALPFSATQAAGIPHDRSIAERDDVLLHAFVYARHILLAARGDRSLARALQLVQRDPHRLFTSERATVSLAVARRIDTRTLARIASGADGVVEAGFAKQTALARHLGGVLPASIDVPRVEHTLDTAENRFVLELIKQLRALMDGVDRIARTRTSAYWRSVLKDCEAMRRVLGPFERHDMWIDVGRMTHVPIGSAVLQRRRGYKEVLRHHLALRAAARIPIDHEQLEAQLLGMKDVASLYELWCYFAVVAAVSEVMGREPDTATSYSVKVDEVGVPWGFRVAWGGGPTVYYNLSFNPKAPPPRRSSSLALRPDVVLEVERGGVRELHVFDAKLRVDNEPDSPTFKNEDVVKMHAYRDALPAVCSARVIYPGTISCDYFALEAGACETDVVGAIGLTPGGKSAALVAAVRRVIA